MRQLEIIGEATNWLIKLGLLDHKQYRKIVDFRNIIAHAYFGIDEEEVWHVIKYRLEAFAQDLQSLIAQNDISLLEAIQYAKEETLHQDIMLFLDQLKS